MSKRYNSPQQSGDRKKPRLDLRVSDHNFPLSQNAGSNNVENQFDDIDDELLLQASQACEQACNASMLPTYSQFRPPALSSTQLPSGPSTSTSKGIFLFKKPSAGQTNTISTNLKDKCDRISSPLRGISSKVTETIDLTGNYFNDKVLDTQDTNYVYRQLLELKEQNAKLKSENGILLEKCVTKEGEASILRNQLKTCQKAVDNARLDKIKVNEQAQIQWSEKLNVVNEQLSDLRTQLDTKNLEIISMKEKCKMLESNKIKLTQITVAGNDISRLNNTLIVPSLVASPAKKVKTISTTAQTENIRQFLKLSKPCRIDKTKVTSILPLIMESPTEPQHSILDYNEKLKRPTEFSPNKSRILNSFYRPCSSIEAVGSAVKVKLNLSSIYEDLMCIAAYNNDVEKAQEHYNKILESTLAALEGVRCELEAVSKRMTSAFQKEMDARYLDATTEYLVVGERDLIAGKALFKEEQCILARRLTAVLRTVLDDARALRLVAGPAHRADRLHELLDLLVGICTLLDDNCCGVFYSGLVLAIVSLVGTVARGLPDPGGDPSGDPGRVAAVVRRAVSCRAMLFVTCQLLTVVTTCQVDVNTLCSGGANLKNDYDQGVLLFKKDTCLLQVFLRQLEAAVKCMEGQRLTEQLVSTTRCLLQLHSMFLSSPDGEQKARCKCDNVLAQVMVYALKICSTMLEDPGTTEAASSPHQTDLLSVCRSGLQTVYQRSLRDAEFAVRLDYNEGSLVTFCELLHRHTHNDFYSTMLSEMLATFQTAEDGTRSSHQQPWLHSFKTFTLAD